MAATATIPPAVLASLLAALVASLGLAGAAWRAGWAERHAGTLTAFAAGVLVTAGLALLPEAASASARAPLAALAGYLLLYGSSLAASGRASAAAAPLLAISLHSFVDGLEYGVLFEHDPQLGLAASVGLIAHEFAEGVVLFALLRAVGLRVRPALVLAFLGAAVTTPLGAAASQPLLGVLDEGGTGLLLGGAAGALLYVGATHLPAHLGGPGGRARGPVVLAYLAGVALSLSLVLDHGRPHDDQGPSASVRVGQP